MQAWEAIISTIEDVCAGIKKPLKPDQRLVIAGAVAVFLDRPIDMILHCPKCNAKHVDRVGPGWNNPPHRSHLCYWCGYIWRPADVNTNGVESIKTKGVKDGD